ncbi:amino acid ABC transporter permease [Staphylococcus massiliensis]|uniref:amino acid ABC transporter permease n=1 Tax=Staphylococcus massiliensis TaxID=555791 RepID=UPI001EDDFD9D|nr:amino acid ABC transporter permease [Staphylococcus massiliensis]MCG3399406.1 amino acid ABC transporter permease [Staphylococcus massiliensis]
MTFLEWIDLFKQILRQLPITLFIFAFALVFSILFGFVLAYIRIQNIKGLSFIVRIFQSFIRSTPLILQLFLVYFALPQVLLLIGININHLDRFWFIVLAFSLHTSAYIAEIMRAAYLSVDYGQIEAAKTVGIKPKDILLRILLPQAFKNSVPNMTTQTIELFKDTSIAFTIGIIDMMGQVNLIIGNNYGLGMLEVYVAISIIYWIICILIQATLTAIDKKLEISKTS